jgi:Ca2+-binding EF-hand superfamily protein
LQTRLPALTETLSAISEVERECQAANVEENDYTVFTYRDLEFEHELVVQSISKKITFIDNQVFQMSSLHSQYIDRCSPQIVSRNMTNLTPAQLEQFESTFRYFDKDESNTLEPAEMTAALASLGIVYSVCLLSCSGTVYESGSSQEEDMYLIYDQLVQDYGAVTYEAFINLLVRLSASGLSEVALIAF